MTTQKSPVPVSSQTYERRILLFWSVVLIVFILTVWLLKKALLPFLLGAAIAYMLDPLMRRLARWRIPRAGAALIILGVFLAVVGVILALTVPFAYRELKDLLVAAPQYITKLRGFLADQAGPVARRLGLPDGVLQTAVDPQASANGAAPAAAPGIKTALSSWGGGFAAGVLSGGKAVAETLATLVLMPVVAFYMMNEWPAITGWIDHLIPRRNYKTIHLLLGKIDVKLASFIRGQLLISLCLSLYYGIALTVAGVPYGFLIGVATGVLAMVPYVSAPFGMITSAVFAWLNGQGMEYYAILAGIFVIGHILEGYVLTPRLMGRAVGMDPLWVLFAIIAGGSLFGVTGMLLAVPVTASLGVLCSFAIERYRESIYYTGPGA